MLPEFVRDLVENDWKNHSTYVRFVAYASEDLLQSGLISEVEKILPGLFGVGIVLRHQEVDRDLTFPRLYEVALSGLL